MEARRLSTTGRRRVRTQGAPIPLDIGATEDAACVVPAWSAGLVLHSVPSPEPANAPDRHVLDLLAGAVSGARDDPHDVAPPAEPLPPGPRPVSPNVYRPGQNLAPPREHAEQLAASPPELHLEHVERPHLRARRRDERSGHEAEHGRCRVGDSTARCGLGATRGRADPFRARNRDRPGNVHLRRLGDREHELPRRRTRLLRELARVGTQHHGRRATRAGSEVVSGRSVISTPFGASARGLDRDGEPASRDVVDLERSARARRSFGPGRRRTPSRARRRSPAAPPSGGRAVPRPKRRRRDRACCAEPVSSPASSRASDCGRPWARTAAAPAATAAAALVPLTVPYRTSPSSPRPGSEVGTATPGATSSGLSPPPNASPREENAATEAPASFSAISTAPTATVTGTPAGEHRANLLHELGREPDDGNADRNVETEGAGREPPVDEHHRRAGGRRFFDGLLGEPSSREQSAARPATALIPSSSKKPAMPRAACGPAHRNDGGGDGSFRARRRAAAVPRRGRVARLEPARGPSASRDGRPPPRR